MSNEFERTLWQHTDVDGDTIRLYVSVLETVRLTHNDDSSQGTDLTHDAAAGLVKALCGRFGLSYPAPEPEVSVIPVQFRALGDLLRDAFRQRSSLYAGMLAQHTATHEMIDDSLSNQNRLLAETRDLLRDQLSQQGSATDRVHTLLAEIRDRLPAPPPPDCGHAGPDENQACELPEGHGGRHGSGISSWPQKCGEASPYGGPECHMSRGHSRNHANGVHSWLAEEPQACPGRLHDAGQDFSCTRPVGHANMHQCGRKNW